MKQYFLQFDIFNTKINKFYFGIVTFDLEETGLIDCCKTIIMDRFPDVDPEEVEIKVNALNNIGT